MSEPCVPYSVLLPVKQRDALRVYCHKNQVPVARCVRAAIDSFLQNAKSNKQESSGV